jgi:hypothetical protein
MGTSPNKEVVNNDERKTGILPGGSEDMPLSLDLNEEDILRVIGNKVEESENFWNKELKLDEVRKTADDYYLGNTYKEEDLYEFQIPYKNNRIITAVETLLPMVVSQIPLPIATEGSDTDESRQLSDDLEDVLVTLYEDLGIKGCFKMGIRHILQGKRVAILKYRFDPDAGERLPDGGRKGAIVVETVRPEKVVFAAEASNPDNIELIAEYMSDTIEALVFKFPEKKEKIFTFFGIRRGTKSQQARKVGYMEIWFTYLDAKGKPQEALAWALDKDLLLGAVKNPNWNYNEFEQQPDGKYRRLNFFDAPKKPYILINHINLGKYVIDDTSLADQAHLLQDVLEKRGRQIVENADQASSGLVLNSGMISPEDAAKLIGDPTEKIMVDGDVREAAARLPYNMLPAYVINDKADARAEIDNIFGANAALRGEKTGDTTLGAQVLSQRANAGRIQTITDAIEEAAAKLYPALVQMMKVYWDEPEIVRYNQSEGKTKFIEWESDKIEDGVKVRVKQGSATPRDKESIRQETIQTIAILDPLSIAEGLDKPNPKEFAKRIVYYRFFMDKYLTEILGDDGSSVDSQAMADIHALTQGQTPPVPEAPSKEYLATFEKFMQSEGFKSITDVTIKQNIVAFAQAVMDKAKAGIGEPGTVQSEQNPAAPAPAEQAGVVPGETPAAPAAPEGQPATQPAPTAAPVDNTGQNFLQRIISRVRGK